MSLPGDIDPALVPVVAALVVLIMTAGATLYILRRAGRNSDAARAALQESEEKFHAMFDSASDGLVVIVAGTGRIILSNRRIRDMLGYSREEFQDLLVTQIHLPYDRSDGVRDFKDSFDKGPLPALNLPMKRKDGSAFYCDLVVSKFRIQGQEHFLANYRDARTRKQDEIHMAELAVARASVDIANQKAGELEAAYHALEKSQDQLIQAGKMVAVGTLSAGVAHELNNPLTGILGIARAYSRNKDPDDRESRDLQQIIFAGERIAGIIKGLLVFSRPSSGTLEELNCIDIIEGVLGFSQKIMHGRDILVEKDFEKELPLIMANNNRIQQVVFNIINNAFDAMQGKGALKIKTRSLLENTHHFVEMEFTDTGCGIRKEDIRMIFDPFFTSKRPGKGTGLGLSVSYAIVKEYGGEILVESPPDGQASGASFKVRIPAIDAEVTG